MEVQYHIAGMAPLKLNSEFDMLDVFTYVVKFVLYTPHNTLSKYCFGTVTKLSSAVI